MRGEKPLLSPVYVSLKGSSPRARGKEIDFSFCIFTSRIIPACAGKRSVNSKLHIINGDHPRVRGEKLYTFKNSLPVLGSSPRARGKVLAGCDTLCADRIIPACAGKSYKKPVERRLYRDHPRVRGEKNRERQHQPL